MKFWSVNLPRAKNVCGFASGLVLLAAVPMADADAAPTDAPAKLAQLSSQSAKAKAKPAAPSEPAECVRTGQRVIAALARDDSGAASQFHNFYVAFKCPPHRLAQAFGCLVNLQAANPGLNNPSPEQVAQCWDDPATLPKVQPQPPANEADGGKK